MKEMMRVFLFQQKLHDFRKTSFPILSCLLMILCCAPLGKAQDSPGRFEVGGNLTVLRTDTTVGFQPGVMAHYGPGLEGDFNFGRHFALDAALSWLPDTTPGLRNNLTQGLFGAKVGTRTQHFGFFGKVRPGFVTTRHTLREVTIVLGDLSIIPPRFARLTEPAIDFGGVFEYYPSKHWALRYDMGDTVVFEEGFRGTFVSATLPPDTQTIPGQTKHRFQFNTGVHYRF